MQMRQKRNWGRNDAESAEQFAEDRREVGVSTLGDPLAPAKVLHRSGLPRNDLIQEIIASQALRVSSLRSALC